VGGSLDDVTRIRQSGTGERGENGQKQGDHDGRYLKAEKCKAGSKNGLQYIGLGLTAVARSAYGRFVSEKNRPPCKGGSRCCLVRPAF
jgi:hypothetical protein